MAAITPKQHNMVMLATALRTNISSYENFGIGAEASPVEKLKVSSKYNDFSTEFSFKVSGNFFTEDLNTSTDQYENGLSGQDIFLWNTNFLKLRPPPNNKCKKKGVHLKLLNRTCEDIIAYIIPFMDKFKRKKLSNIHNMEKYQDVINDDLTTLKNESDENNPKCAVGEIPTPQKSCRF